jgi:hypothetical protein
LASNLEQFTTFYCCQTFALHNVQIAVVYDCCHNCDWQRSW